MNIKNIIEHIILRWITSGRVQKIDRRSSHLNNLLVIVLHMIKQTDDFELSCDEVLELIDRYAESSLKGEDVGGMYLLVTRHLDGCGDCLEEYEALARTLVSSAEVGTFATL
jgi:hypothetical protein